MNEKQSPYNRFSGTVQTKIHCPPARTPYLISDAALQCKQQKEQQKPRQRTRQPLAQMFHTQQRRPHSLPLLRRPLTISAFLHARFLQPTTRSLPILTLTNMPSQKKGTASVPIHPLLSSRFHHDPHLGPYTDYHGGQPLDARPNQPSTAKHAEIYMPARTTNLPPTKLSWEHAS